MKKNRMVAGIVLTTGLGLTGVVAASPSGAATPEQAKPGSASAVATSSTHKGGGPVLVCVGKVGLPGKPVPGKPLPGIPGKPLPGKPGKPGKVTAPGGKLTVKVVGGKVYVNGKLVPKTELRKCPPVPPMPPLPGKGKGKGFVCVIEKGPGKPAPGKTTVKVVGGKVYVNGKRVPKDKLPKCPLPPLPPFPGKGHGKGHGVVVIERGVRSVLGSTTGVNVAGLATTLAG